MSEKPTAAEASTLHDEGLLNVTDFLYVLRNEAGQAAEKLWDEITRLQGVLIEANLTHARLSYIANSAEQAAEREWETRRGQNDDG